MMFGESHLFLSFKTKKERAKYWLGRLVQTKASTRVDLFKVLPPSTLGLVIDVEEEKNGTAFVLIVRWLDGSVHPCYQSSVYTQEGE